MNRIFFFLLCLFGFFFSGISMLGQNLSDLPLFSMDELNYEGAFRLPADEIGVSSMNFAQGPLVYNPENNSIFIVGHSHVQAIAEFSIPALVNSETISDLNMADDPLQSFVAVLDETSDGNPQALDRIGGLLLFEQNGQQKLLVNAYEYYDAPADNSLTSLIIDNPDDLVNSSKQGYFEFEGGAGHTSGWMSPVPSEWSETLGGPYITGQSSGEPIIGRFSVGPSAFSFDPDEISDPSVPISTTKLLDFSLDNPLDDDLSNESFQNNLWTHLSRATYGFIVPGTRTYFTLGHSGGHNTGVCYKCEQNNGIECGGYCPPDTADYNQSYWLWDLNDLLDVKNGVLAAHEVLPYDYGEFETPFQNVFKEIGGASFDPVSGNLYLTIQRADNEQGVYSNPPIVVVYNAVSTSTANVFLDESGLSIYPNPSNEIFEIQGLLADYSIQILDATGNVYQTIISTESTIQINLMELPIGLYFVKITNNENTAVQLQKIIKQ